MSFSQTVLDKKDSIIDAWMAQVCAERAIESTQRITYEAVLESLPRLIAAIAHLLQRSGLRSKLPADIVQSSMRSLQPETSQAVQGCDAEEIVREYAIFRDVIFDVLEPELLRSEPLLLFKTTRLIDGAIDQVIVFSLKRFTEARLRDVNLLYDEMVASNQELDRLLRNEQTNLTHLVHELKSPLSCIIGYSDLFLRQQDHSGHVHLDFIERVLSSGRKLLEMINDSLEMSFYQSGKVTISPEPVQVCEMVAEVVTVLDMLARQKGLTIETSCDRIHTPIVTDKNRLRQVVTNVISNAIRYTETGSIRVRVRAAVESVEIEVVDTGVGIEAAEQTRIFEPYYQGQAGQDLPSSTGLGLAIAHQMVTLLQGSIRLRSELGVGSTFTIILPLQWQPELA